MLHLGLVIVPSTSKRQSKRFLLDPAILLANDNSEEQSIQQYVAKATLQGVSFGFCGSGIGKQMYHTSGVLRHVTSWLMK